MDEGGRATHDPKDGGGREASGTAAEDAKAERQPRTRRNEEQTRNRMFFLTFNLLLSTFNS
jgi:hypothetical protein